MEGTDAGCVSSHRAGGGGREVLLMRGMTVRSNLPHPDTIIKVRELCLGMRMTC